MARKQTFLAAEWSESWKASYAALPADRQSSCDRAVISLIKQESSPGLRIKPIHPDKHYNEARISSGERIVFRTEEGTIHFVDVVKHDDISRYGKKRGH
jgi:hypothetical protein